MQRARLPALFSRASGGRSSAREEYLALNFSYVLHEGSTSQTVLRAVQASRRYRKRRQWPAEIILDGIGDLPVDVWLTASVGNPDRLPEALESQGLELQRVLIVDSGDEQVPEIDFFRGPAHLNLPGDEVTTVGVAALIMRPGNRTLQLIVRGPFSWPADTARVLRAIEEIVQAHIEQWHPPRPLWPHPAEVLLPDEVQ